MIKAYVFDAYGTLYDVQSVARAIADIFPTHSDTITQIWRLKQLEYSWLRSLMGRYEDFQTVTRESLDYALATIGLSADEALVARILDAYDSLSPYPEAEQALTALSAYRRAILSNGSPAMLDALVRDSGLDRHLDALISVDARRVYKPDPRAYELVQERLGIPPEEVVFVSSNGFDIAGARAFGFNVARIERVTQAIMRAELTGEAPIGPATMFRARRMQNEALGFAAPTQQLIRFWRCQTSSEWTSTKNPDEARTTAPPSLHRRAIPLNHHRHQHVPHRREPQAQCLRHRDMRHPAAIDIQPLGQMRIVQHGLPPALASERQHEWQRRIGQGIG
jgi:2-haloacid dehalogenase